MKLRSLVALLVAIPIIFLTTGAHQAPESSAPVPTTLVTAPAVQQWMPATGGQPVRHAGHVLVVQPGHRDLYQVAQTFAEDLAALMGTRPRVVVGTKVIPEAIRLVVGAQAHGPESYTVNMNKSVTITGATAHGVFNGTRTLLQLLHQSRTLPSGTIVDWPQYEVRSVLVDNTPRHFSLDWWENFFKQMSYYKLNDTNLYLDGVGMETSDITEIDRLGAKYFVKVVPQINMPSHMSVLLPSHPEYQLVNTDGTRNPTALDLTNPKAVQWALGLIEKFIGTFSGDEWHLGSDEFPGWPGTGANHPQLDAYAKQRFGTKATFADLYADFQNQANAIVKAHGKKMRVWNDMIRQSSVVRLDKDVTVEYWIQHDELPGLLTAQQIADRGNLLINAHVDHLYYDQSRRNLDPRDIYERLVVNEFHQKSTVDQAATRGARVAVWLAWIYTSMESDAEVLSNLNKDMAALGQVTWGSPKIAATWTDFQAQVLPTVGPVSGMNPQSINSIMPAPVAAHNVDGTVVYVARDARGNLWTGKQLRPAVTHFSQTLVGRGVVGDPAVATLPDGRLQIAARTSSGRLLVATQVAPNAEQLTAKVLRVRIDADPALVAGTVVVNSHGQLMTVDAATGKTTMVARGTLGKPAAVLVDGVVHLVSRACAGVVYASQDGSGWYTIASPTKLSSTPQIHALSGKAIIVGITNGGMLSSALVDGDALRWTSILDQASGQQSSAVGTNGTVHVVTLTAAHTLEYAWFDGTWHHAQVDHHMAADSPTVALSHLNEPFMFAKWDNGMQMTAVPTGSDQYARAALAESTTGPSAATMDSMGRPIYFVATTYGDLQTGTKWGNLWEWGRDFAIGTMSYPDDSLTPSSFERVRLKDSFDRESASRYTVLKTSASESAPQPTVSGGVMEVTGDQPFYSTVVSDVSVSSGDTVVIVSVDKWLEGPHSQDTVMLGFVRDAKNYSVMWVSHSGNRIGFDTMSNGRLTADGAGGNVPVVVEKGDRLAVVLSGNWMTGYVQRNGVWHRVHSGIANGYDNLRDPAVRQQYRYAVAFRGDAGGTLRIGELIAAS